MNESQSASASGVVKIESETMKPLSAGTIAIVPMNAKSSAIEDIAESPLEDLKQSSDVLKEAVLDSTIFADNAMIELQSHLSGMFSDQPDTEVKRYEADRVQTAAMVGRTIAELIKAKTDSLRLLK